MGFLKDRIIGEGVLTADFEVEIEGAKGSGWRVTLAYTPRAAYRKMVDRNSKKVWSAKDGGHVTKLDAEALNHDYAKFIIKGWTGLTVGGLRKLIAFKTAGLKDEEVIPFTQENAVEILQHSDEFAVWVTTIATNPAMFEGPTDPATAEVERKN